MVTVEAATHADLDALVELESALFVEDAGVHDPHADPSWPQREGRQDFERLLASHESLVLIAKRSGEAVGFLDGYATTSSPTRQPVQFAVLRSLYVGASARRIGVARLLTQQFLEWARSSDCVEVTVDHYTANSGASQLYEDLGFKPQSLTRTLSL